MAGNRGTDGHLISITGGLVGAYIKLDGSNTPTTGIVTFGHEALMATTVQLQFGSGAMYLVDDGANLTMYNTGGDIYFNSSATINADAITSIDLQIATNSKLLIEPAAITVATTVPLQFGAATRYITDDGTDILITTTGAGEDIKLNAKTRIDLKINSSDYIILTGAEIIAKQKLSVKAGKILSLFKSDDSNFATITKGATDNLTMLEATGNIEITASATSGNIILSSANSTNRDSPEIQTTDATVTTVDTVTLEDEHTYLVDVKVVAMESDGSDRNMYHLEGLFYCDGGNATQQGATTSITTIESEAGCDLVFDVTGNDVRVRWTGIVAETWNVTGKIEITEVD